ncbi:MAG TPA: ribosome assembly RNA-binding protein YhbY [Thiobacillaceae bacterium]|nr:ribosome assembly RNA-binding protein YhbY [Thiobacillaceae bacterium]HNA83800.1 ribosome assembly RNA-binding protein YhbY [Thiobacillaceae bacterium]HNF90049.1 ribosome assembly RNA-binding protein YhbY [Thiobacillaceae bacterium]HNI08938.1 ribosome assembly RNA-binding protein YhbY [Thiobacillaceae bacterium]
MVKAAARKSRELTPEQRKFLKAQAHPLKPVVMIGAQGLTEAVIKEAGRALVAHELIKVRVLGDDREAREAYLAELCAALDAAPVQHIGKLLLLYRPADKPKIQLP